MPEDTSRAKKKQKLNQSDETSIERFEPQTIKFEGYPDFRPNLTPKQMFELGSFQDQGGYFRPIKSMHFKQKLKNVHTEFTAKGKCLEGVKLEKLIAPNGLTKNELIQRNRYRVRAGSTLQQWEDKEWIDKQDPYGWVHWYCRFFDGRRSYDDERQIKRWINFAGTKGRWKRFLMNKVIAAKTTFDDEKISPVTRQNLQHWAYQLTEDDLNKYKPQK